MSFEPPRILGVNHTEVTIPNKAEDAGRKFYCDFMGFKEIPKPEALAGRGGFWLTIPSASSDNSSSGSSISAASRSANLPSANSSAPSFLLVIHIGTEDGVNRSATKSHVAYEVNDLDSWKNKLKQAGFQWFPSVKLPMWDRIEFRDPFGNRIELMMFLGNMNSNKNNAKLRSTL